MLLEVEGLSVAYERTQVLWDVSISLEAGEIVALLGPNGSGKSTLMNSISGLIAPSSGAIRCEGRDIKAEPAYRRVQLGIAHVLERHRLFPYMTVLENLTLGAGPNAGRQKIRDGLESMYQLFPRLAERQRQMAGTLSGGEQQMCAIARGLMAGPRLLMVDEPFIGLSPHLRDLLEGALRTVHQSGIGVLLIEQNVREALRMSQRAYILRAGRVVLSGSSNDIGGTAAIRDAFMGVQARRKT